MSPRENEVPNPHLRAPVIAPVGDPGITLDASKSFDPDADPLTYVFEMGGLEAVESADPSITYVFPEPGLYTVRVRVIDIHGAEAIAAQDVTAREDYPSDPDFCVTAADCVIGDECFERVCYANGGAIDP